ncbi:MAG: hypothetical protein A2Y72_00680 [Chloroflexi bacterium RBG_13_53_26]|nr:MAG: hypothetical protein A2Y72_00680 [Chloroflexi bacterium RBG_13_53_26]
MKQSQRVYVAAGVTVALILVAAILFAWQWGWLPFERLFLEQKTPIEIAISEEVPASGEVISRYYEWRYDRHAWELTLLIPSELYTYYRGMERAPTPDYSIYVTHPSDDDYIQSLADSLNSKAESMGYSAEEEVNFAASFVQGLDYFDDEEGEYPRYPVETLVDGGGDCEDTSVLAAALLQAMGYDVVLLSFSATTPEGSGHMAVGVALPSVTGGHSYDFEGEDYYYLETTTVSQAGDIPAEYRIEVPIILEVVPKPILSLSKLEWTILTKWLREDKLVLEVAVTNWGTADAEGLYVRAFFEGHETGAGTSDTFDLEYGYRISPVSVGEMVIPSGGGTLCVELYDDGIKVDEWSEAI